MSESTPYILPEAVFWDLDGTLIDSEPYWAQVEKGILEGLGLPWDPTVAAKLQGGTLDAVAQFMIGSGLKDMTADEIIGFVTDKVYEAEVACMPWTQGAVELLTVLRDAGIPSVLVTSSPRKLALNAVEQAPHGAFVGYICNEDPYPHKPDPAPYLQAARMVGVDIAKCLIFEDSIPGLTAASRSGARWVAITGYSQTDTRALGLSEHYIENYDHVDLAYLSSIFSS